MTVVVLPRPAIAFTVYGDPGVAGNKTPGITKTGRRFVREGHSAGAVRLARQWRQRVTDVVQRVAEGGAPLLDGPLVAGVVFYRAKPKSAPKTRRTWPDTLPDLSKYLRAIEDPMKGVLIVDDARIVEFAELRKAYPEDETPQDPRPRADVRLWRLEDYHGLTPDRHDFQLEVLTGREQRCGLCWRPAGEHGRVQLEVGS